MKIRNLYLIGCVILTSIVSASCNKISSPQPTEENEMILLGKYIAKFHPGLSPRSSGLYYVETKAAADSAVAIVKGDVVNVFYNGFLIADDPKAGVSDGYNFDGSGITPFTFTVGAGAVIPGWDEGVAYMKDGTEAKLIIPSRLAYGGMQISVIPGFSSLVFYLKASKKKSAN